MTAVRNVCVPACKGENNCLISIFEFSVERYRIDKPVNISFLTVSHNEILLIF
jgi:hypothetical protein